MPNIIKNCKYHGDTDFVLENRGYYRCKKCRVEKVTNCRKNRKKKLVEHFGGKCQICSYKKCITALTFHHLKPEDKSFGIAESGACRTWEALLQEAKKCILLCCRCHAEVESGITEIPQFLLDKHQ